MSVHLFTVIGIISAALVTIRFLRFLHLYNQRSTFHRYVRPGAWALVTGSSDGIGLALVYELAAKELNIVLHGRNIHKLDGVKQGLILRHPGIAVRILVADATDSHGMKKTVAAMIEELAQLPGPLTIMINNVGGTPMIPETFRAMEEFSTKDVDDVINLNVRFTAHLTRGLLPVLRKSTPSLVINVGSIAGTSGVPFVSLYSGAKACNNQWSIGLTRELESMNVGIECLGLIVGTVSNTSGLRDSSSWLVPNATTLARSALHRVGCGRPLVVAYYGHAILLFISQIIPEPARSAFVIAKVEEHKDAQRLSRAKRS